MFLVVGITGNVGGAAARHLLSRGKQVRALVRNREKAAEWSRQGVELVDGDWNDANSIGRALKGVEGAYVMMPPIVTPSRDFREAKAVIAAYLEAFAQAAPPRVVALSSMGSEQTSKLGLITSTSLMEHAFRDLAFPVAFLRAGGFYENYLYGLQAGQSGTLPVFYDPADRALPMVATEDIGEVAARLLSGPEWSGVRTIELGSMVSPDDIAKQLGQVLGREVKAQVVPRQAWAGALEHMGLPQGQTWGYEEMIESVNSGWVRFGVDGTERMEGTRTARDVFSSRSGRAQS